MNPEEHYPGVLGRIGSWFSPWRERSPKSDDASPTDEQTQRPEGEELQEPVRGPNEGEQTEEQGQNSQPDEDSVFYSCEEADATPSAHRYRDCPLSASSRSSSSSSTSESGGGTSKEEWAEQREKRRQKEESGSSAVSSNPALERNASDLTHLSSSLKQGVVWDSDRYHTQTQAQVQAGRRLHVYLEETSVSQSGEDSNAVQEVVQTTVKKSILLLSEKTPECSEGKRTVFYSIGAKSHSNALGGLSLKSQTDTQPIPELSAEESDTDTMGRKNTGRRRSRKGDVAGSSLENTPNKTQTASLGSPTSDNPATSPLPPAWEETHLGEDLRDSSSSKDTPASLTSPQGGNQGSNACSVLVETHLGKELQESQDIFSPVHATLASVIDGKEDMEVDVDDSPYRVERRTETPESKRRSVKVSHSEVKFFAKKVLVNSEPEGESFLSPEGDKHVAQGSKTVGKDKVDTAKGRNKPEVNKRPPDLKKVDEKPKPDQPMGRITDKISLFEGRAVGVTSKTYQSPRSADVSPVRKITQRLKSNVNRDLGLPDRREESAERSNARSSSAPPVREKTKTVKERARNIAEACKMEDKTTLVQQSAMTGMSQKSTTPAAVSKSTEQGSLARASKTQTAKKTEITKPVGPDTTSVTNIPVPKEHQTDSKTKDKDASGNLLEKPTNVVPNTAKGQNDSVKLATEARAQAPAPSRSGSKFKKRKSKDPASPMSPSNDIKQESPSSEQEVVNKKQEKTGTTKDITSDEDKKTVTSPHSSKSVDDKSTDKVKMQSPSENSQKPVSKIPEVSGKQIDSSLKKDNIIKPVREKGISPTPPKVKEDKARNSGPDCVTKELNDKPVACTLPLQSSGGQGGESCSSIVKENQKLPKDNSLASLPSPSPQLEQPTVQVNLATPVEQGSPAPDTKVDDQAKQPEKIGAEKLKQPDSSEKKTEKEIPSGSRQDTPETAAGKAKSKEDPMPVLNISKSESKLPKPAVKPSVTTVRSPLAPLPIAEPISQTSNKTSDKTPSCAVTETVKTVKEEDRDKCMVKTPKKVPDQKAKAKEDPGSEKQQTTEGELQCGSVSVVKPDTPCDDTHTHEVSPPSELTTSKPSSSVVSAMEETTGKAVGEASKPTPVDSNQSPDSESKVPAQRKPVAPVKEDLLEPEQRSIGGPGLDVGKESPTVNTVAPEVKSTKEVRVEKALPSQSQSEEREKTLSNGRLAEGKGETLKSNSSTTTTSTTTVVERTDENKLGVTGKEPAPIVNGEIHTLPESMTANEISTSLPSPSKMTKSPSSTETTKQSPASPQRPSLNKLLSTRGASGGIGGLSPQRDAPSSWLDVDFPMKKLCSPEPKLSSSVSESNLLDMSGELDDDFKENIKRLGTRFNLPPRKHSHLRAPQPPFAMPAIREDRFEKPFDPDEFKIGLRKRGEFMDTTPSARVKFQSTEAKGDRKPLRASLTDRGSILLKTLDTRSRLLLDRENSKEEEKEECEDKKEEVKVKSRLSRLDGSCILSSLISSSSRSKKTQVQPQTDPTQGGDVSPGESPLPSPLPVTQLPQLASSFSRESEALANQNPTLGNGTAAQAVVSDSGPPLPSFNDIKLPDYLEKYLPQEPARVELGSGQQQLNSEAIGGINPLVPSGVDLNVRPGLLMTDGGPPSLPGAPPPTLPEVQHPLVDPLGGHVSDIRAVKGFHRRPGKMVLFEHAQFGGQAYDVFRDMVDTTSFKLSALISVRVVRGCWLLYEKPGFEGRSIALEEGPIELTNVWAEPGPPGPHPHVDPPMVIGSIRLAVWDYTIPHIDLFTEPEGRGRVTPYQDDTIEIGSFGIQQNTASIKVHTGVWMVFSDPGFQGLLAVLENGEYPCPESWGFPTPFIGSLRPLKMGGFKVENPHEVKALVYERPGFEGPCLEIDSDIFSFHDGGEGENNTEENKLKSVGSVKIIGGLWVGYDRPGFEGHQHVLEEGEYQDWGDWGGVTEQLLSIRPVLADFMSSHVKMFSERDFAELGVNIDLFGPVTNMEDTGYGLKTQSVDVLGGVWVAFEESGFSGEQYVLEKGLYGNPEDWGALRSKITSIMPVILDNLGNSAKFKVKLFSEPGFQGSSCVLEDSVPALPEGFSLGSCRVLTGSWLAFEGQGFTERMYVLEEGAYPDLRSMGCVRPNSSVLSLQTTGFEFTLPSITLFERSGLRGKKVVLTTSSVNLQLAGGCSRVQSVLVEGGMWVLYQEINYRGAQLLLKSGQVPDWRKFSSWQRIGSLRSLVQKQVHFRLRNNMAGLLMSVTGELDDVKMIRIQATEETDGVEQIWFYRGGHLHCKMLEDCCMVPSSSVTMAGSRLGLSPEPDTKHHLWNITTDGLIRCIDTPDLFLEVKGGELYDKNQVVLNTFDPNKLNQRWSLEIL